MVTEMFLFVRAAHPKLKHIGSSVRGGIGICVVETSGLYRYYGSRSGVQSTTRFSESGMDDPQVVDEPRIAALEARRNAFASDVSIPGK